jgi:hypothetical protein
MLSSVQQLAPNTLFFAEGSAPDSSNRLDTSTFPFNAATTRAV